MSLSIRQEPRTVVLKYSGNCSRTFTLHDGKVLHLIHGDKIEFETTDVQHPAVQYVLAQDTLN